MHTLGRQASLTLNTAGQSSCLITIPKWDTQPASPVWSRRAPASAPAAAEDGARNRSVFSKGCSVFSKDCLRPW